MSNMNQSLIINTDIAVMDPAIKAEITPIMAANIETQPVTITENGIYRAPKDIAYTPVTVNVPNTYTDTDEGMVVQNGALQTQHSISVTSNQTIDTTIINEVAVNVPTVDPEPVIIEKNGTYIAPSGKAYTPITVNIDAEFDTINCMGTKYSDLPDLSKLDRTSQVIYFVVDTAMCTYPLWEKFSIRPSGTGTLTMSRGYIGENGYVDVESETVVSASYYVKQLTDDGHRFWVFRFTSTGDITRFDAPSVVQLISPNDNPLVAIYANAPKLVLAPGGNVNLMMIDAINLISPELLRIPSSESNSIVSIKATGTIPIAVVNLFYSKSYLRSVDFNGADLLGSTSIKQMFYNCPSLQSVKLGTQNLSGITSIINLFAGCRKMITLDLSGVDFSGVTEATNAFYNMASLTNITGWTNIPVSYSLSGSPGLTHDSLVTVIAALPQVNTPQTLTLGSTNLARLSADEIAVATEKGWTVV